MTDVTKKTTTVKALAAQVAAWDAAAAACNMSRHAWMVAMLDVASGRSSLAAHLKRLPKTVDSGVTTG